MKRPGMCFGLGIKIAHFAYQLRFLGPNANIFSWQSGEVIKGLFEATTILHDEHS